MKEYDVDTRKLDKLTIYQLRDVGAKVGVRNPTTMRSAELREAICDIVSGKNAPYRKTKSGRPHKDIIKDEEWDDLVGFNSSFEFSSTNDMLSLYSSISNVHPAMQEKVYSGYVMLAQNELMVAIGNPDDIKIDKFAKITTETSNFSIVKPGDKVTCTIKMNDIKQDSPTVTEILLINNQPPFVEPLEDEVDDEVFGTEDNTANDYGSNIEKKEATLNENGTFPFKYPQLQFLRDKYPMQLGQRALFVGLPQSGQEFLANSIAKDLSLQGYKVVYFSGGKNPEDRINFNENVEYFFSTFDILPKNLIFNFEVAFARAKNLSKQHHVIFVLDDITDLIKYYDMLIRQKSNIQNIDVQQEIIHQFKTIFATSVREKYNSLSIFAFGSTPEAQFSMYYPEIERLINCRFALNHQDFVDGKTTFLDETACYVSPPTRSID